MQTKFNGQIVNGNYGKTQEKTNTGKKRAIAPSQRDGRTQEVMYYALDKYIWQLEFYECKEALRASVFISRRTLTTRILSFAILLDNYS